MVEPSDVPTWFGLVVPPRNRPNSDDCYWACCCWPKGRSLLNESVRNDNVDNVPATFVIVHTRDTSLGIPRHHYCCCCYCCCYPHCMFWDANARVSLLDIRYVDIVVPMCNSELVESGAMSKWTYKRRKEGRRHRIVIYFNDLPARAITSTATVPLVSLWQSRFRHWVAVPRAIRIVDGSNWCCWSLLLLS